MRSHVAERALSLLPDEHLRPWVRRWRGRREAKALERADAVFVSYGKSGRTWLRLMLSRFFQQQFGLREGEFLEFDNLHRQNPSIPRVYFTHGNYLQDYTGHSDAFENFRGHRVVLLIRDPRDIAVSQYFQWGRRMRAHKKWLNGYPLHPTEPTLYDFIQQHEAGLARVIDFHNQWARAIGQLDQGLLLHYEGMRADPGETVRRTLRFLGFEPSDAQIEDAVAYGAFDHMRKLEDSGAVRAKGQRLVPGRKGDWESYKVRRAVVGGFRDYLDEAEIAAIDTRLARELDPVFGYTSPPEARAAHEPSRVVSAGR